MTKFLQHIFTKFYQSFGSFYSFLTTFANKYKNKTMKLYGFYPLYYGKFCEKIQKITGHSWETLINALTVSSLTQVLIKIGFAIFYIKLSFYTQILLTVIMIPFFIIFESFDLIRNILVKIFWNHLPESSYQSVDPDRFDQDYSPEDASDEHNKSYNHCLLYFINFLIAFRLLILQEPILALFFKFLAIRYFILNEFLVIAYIISFLFIFSRFVFLLTDKTVSNWRLSLGDNLLENNEETPKITKKNIKIMTHWSLRYVPLWDLYKLIQENGSMQRHDENWHLRDLREKFDLQTTKIKSSPKNRYCMYSMFFISFFYFTQIQTFEGLNYLHFDFCFLARLRKNLFKITNNADFLLFQKIYGHHAIFRVTGKSLDVTTLTTFKDEIDFFSLKFPYKIIYPIPPLQITNGVQSYSGITKVLNWKPEFELFIEDHQKNQNPANFLNFDEKIVETIAKKIDDNIMIVNDTLQNLNNSENTYLAELIEFNQKLPKSIIKKSWAVFEKQKYTTEQAQIYLIEANYFFKINFPNAPVTKIQTDLISNYNTYENPFCINQKLPINDLLQIKIDQHEIRHVYNVPKSAIFLPSQKDVD